MKKEEIAQPETVKDILKFIKLEPFAEEFTTLKARGGLYHRVNGKSTAANKTKELTEDDKAQFKAGFTALSERILKVAASL